MSKWTLFSNHGHVLVVLSRDPDARLRDVAQIVGITERAVQKIVRDLQDGGFVSVTKHGRRNRYRLRRNQPLRHTLEAHCTIGELLEMVNQRAPGLEPDEAEATSDAPVPVAAVPVPELHTGPAPLSSEPDRATSDNCGESTAKAAPGTSVESRATDADTDSTEEAPVTQGSRRRKMRPVDDGEQGSLF